MHALYVHVAAVVLNCTIHHLPSSEDDSSPAGLASVAPFSNSGIDSVQSAQATSLHDEASFSDHDSVQYTEFVSVEAGTASTTGAPSTCDDLSSGMLYMGMDAPDPNEEISSGMLYMGMDAPDPNDPVTALKKQFLQGELSRGAGLGLLGAGAGEESAELGEECEEVS